MTEEKPSGQRGRQIVTVYRSRAKEGVYLFLPHGGTPEVLPETLRSRLGRLELSMHMPLTPERVLARTTGREILQALAAQGWYLQTPPAEFPLNPDIASASGEQT